MTEQIVIPEKLKQLQSQLNQKYKVYFDKETGKIQSITKDNTTGDYFEVEYSDIEDFLNSKKKFFDYNIVYNSRKFDYEIVEKKNNKIDLDVNDLIFQIKKNKNPQVKIVQDIRKKSWVITINNTLKEVLKEKSRLEEILLFSITEKNNPNILYRQIFVRLSDLVINDVIFEFLDQKEIDKTDFSVYTNRKFENYSYEVINE